MRFSAFVALMLVAGSAYAAEPKIAADNAPTFGLPHLEADCSFSPAGGTGSDRTKDGLASLSCDQVGKVYVRVSMGEKIKPALEKSPGEQPCCTAEPILPVGATWHGASFTCNTLKDEFICKRPDGRGFSVKKNNVTKF